MRAVGEKDWTFLKAIGDAGLTQRKLSKISGVSHVLLSLYANGRWTFTEVEKERIAKVLRKKTEDVFAF